MIVVIFKAFVSTIGVVCTGKLSPDLTFILSTSIYEHEPNSGNLYRNSNRKNSKKKVTNFVWIKLYI